MSYQEDSRMSEWYKDVIRASALFMTQWSDAFINVYAAILGSIGPHGVQEDMGSDHRYMRPTLILIHDIFRHYSRSHPITCSRGSGDMVIVW